MKLYRRDSEPSESFLDDIKTEEVFVELPFATSALKLLNKRDICSTP